jgi:flagellin
MASFSVVTNIASVNAQANLYSTNLGLRTALTRVSSGFRINYSGDDAAGLAVANSFRSRVAILNQGVRNANDALSDLQVKDGALDNISKLLDRMATLATQAASSSTSDASRATLNSEFKDIVTEITREVGVANMSGAVTSFSVFVSSETVPADGAVSGKVAAINMASGANTADEVFLNISTATIAAAADAVDAVTRVTAAISSLGSAQGQVGQLQNRISYAINLAQTQIVNTKAAESRIRDANIAEESANLTRYNILNQSGIAALAQANQATSAVLTLLR